MDHRNFLKILCGMLVSCTYATTFADAAPTSTLISNSRFHVTALYLQPSSNNLKYAVFVSGNQPYYQSWHNQSINPGYSAAFELGASYAFKQSPYDISIDWLHAGTSDSDSKQASQNTDIATVEFVAPPYDVGPAVFGIKRADSNVKNNFNSVYLNFGRVFEYGSHIQGRVFGGLSFLNINQSLSTTFSDYAGSPIVPSQAYALPADPSFYFNTKNTSKYLGVGPDLGMSIQYKSDCGIGVAGQVTGSLTAGSISAQDNFTSRSARLTAIGIPTSYQQITTPNTTQLVPGIDSRLGLFFTHAWRGADLTIEAGYRFAYFYNALSMISPDTLVQPGLNASIPEFATGTMAINSTTTSTSPFSLNGPFLNFTLGFA